jgi:hypothetical protein
VRRSDFDILRSLPTEAERLAFLEAIEPPARAPPKPSIGSNVAPPGRARGLAVWRESHPLDREKLRQRRFWRHRRAAADRALAQFLAIGS